MAKIYVCYNGFWCKEHNRLFKDVWSIETSQRRAHQWVLDRKKMYMDYQKLTTDEERVAFKKKYLVGPDEHFGDVWDYQVFTIAYSK